MRPQLQNYCSHIPCLSATITQRQKLYQTTKRKVYIRGGGYYLIAIISKPPELTKKEIKEMTAQPLMKRRFLVRASYSSSVQVSWSHPKGANIEGLRYILEYGVGIKVGNIEQFRQIYKGKAFKCIVTDLIPKTNYRFRVAAVLQREGKEEQGEWSDVESVSTTDIQQIDSQSLLNVAVIPPMQKCQSQSMVLQTVAMNQQNSCTLSPIQNAGGISSGNDKWIQFERPGLIHSLNTLTFGKHYWSVLNNFVKQHSHAVQAQQVNCIGFSYTF